MIDTQGRPPASARFKLHSERMAPLPLVNHFIERIGLEDLLSRHIPCDARCAIPHARALGVLLSSLIVEREPIYRQQETVHGFASGMFGIDAKAMAHLSDDRLGRALDHLFDADRTALLTEVVLAVGEQLKLRFDELHNDSTSISFTGTYRAATGRAIRGRTAPAVVFGHSKAHRPDLKQLLFIHDRRRHVPVAFRCTDGNTNDSRTHVQTWNTLRAIAGRADFLYVADSKLCSRENMDHIARSGGRFVTVMPRNRRGTHFLALLIQALIERELRLAMARESIEELPSYPQQRQCAHPTTEQVLRLFSLTQRHRLADPGGLTIQIFDAELTNLQIQILALLGVPVESFQAPM